MRESSYKDKSLSGSALVAALIAIDARLNRWGLRSYIARHGSGAAQLSIRELINAENAHDIAAVSRFVWKSPSALFVAKTKTPAEGNWAGFWGSDNVIAHLGELYQGTFRMMPDYSGREGRPCFRRT